MFLKQLSLITCFLFFSTFKHALFVCFSCAGSSLVRGLSPVATSGGCSLVAVCWLPVALASLAVAPRLESTGSVVVAHRLSCPAARGIFPTRHQTSASCISSRFLTTGPPRKPLLGVSKKCFFKLFFNQKKLHFAAVSQFFSLAK